MASDRPRRILMLNYEYPPLGGGAGNAMQCLLAEFAKDSSLSIDVITASPGKDNVERFSKHIALHRLDVGKRSVNYQTFRETAIWSVRALRLMVRLKRSDHYDLCHCWFGWPSGALGFLNRKRIPYLIALRGSDVPGFNPRIKVLDAVFFRRYSRLVWGQAAAVVANSEGLKELASRTAPGLGIRVIPNGIDTRAFSPASKPSTAAKVLCVARLIPRKGLDYLIEAMPQVQAKFPKAELVIAGDGPEKDNLRRLADAKKVNLRLLGFVPHGKLPEIYRSADVYCLPSLNEGMSNTVLEAMATGLPIVATDTGGTQELIRGNGIIVPERSAGAISRALLSLFGDARKKGVCARASRSLALELSWGSVARQYRRLYEAR